VIALSSVEMKLQVANGMLMGHCRGIEDTVDLYTNAPPSTPKIVFLPTLPAPFSLGLSMRKCGLFDSARVSPILLVVISAALVCSFVVGLPDNRFTPRTEESA
jgi:hypothetical protein